MSIPFPAWVALVSATLIQGAFANGGGFDTSQGWAGDFSPRGATDVEMLSEKLDIRLLPQFADVRITYQLRNDGKKRSVTAGFPCTTYEPKKSEDEDLDFYEPLSLDHYEIAKNGSALPFKVEREKAPQPIPQRLQFLKSETKGPWVTSWNVSTIPFEPNETASVTIHYQVDYRESGTYVSEDSRVNPATFSYVFSSAAIWKGPIHQGTVRLTVDTLFPEEAKIEPAGRFKRDGNVYEWQFTDLEPTAADDLKIQVYGAYNTYSVMAPQRVQTPGNFPSGGDYIIRQAKAFFRHQQFQVTATSVLPPQGENTYAADQIRDIDPSTAWVEGAKGNGIGEGLTLTLENPKPLHSIEITPGYAASDESWTRNNRVAKLKVTLNGEHTFDVSLPDLKPQGHIAFPVQGYAKPVKTVELKIAEVYPGSAYDDTCISDIAIVYQLDKIPKVAGAR